MSKQQSTNYHENVKKGLDYLKGSDRIVGDIINYCVNEYKQSPGPKSIGIVQKYLQDTADSVSDHVLTIAHNISKMLEQQIREIDVLNYDTQFLGHRLNISESYMSSLMMTKFQTYPRPTKTIHILRKTLPDEKLPKSARRRGAWKRQKEFNYKLLDKVGKNVVLTGTSENSNNQNTKSGYHTKRSSQSMTLSTVGLSTGGTQPPPPTMSSYQSGSNLMKHTGETNTNYNNNNTNNNNNRQTTNNKSTGEIQPGETQSPPNPPQLMQKQISAPPPPQPPNVPQQNNAPPQPPKVPQQNNGPPNPPNPPQPPNPPNPPQPPNVPQNNGPPNPPKPPSPPNNTQSPPQPPQPPQPPNNGPPQPPKPPSPPNQNNGPPQPPKPPSPPNVGGPPPVPNVGGPPPVPKIGGPPPVPNMGGPPPVPNVGGPPPVPQNNNKEAPEEYKPFIRMIKMGVPRVAVDGKMSREGYDPSELDAYI